MAQQSLLSNGDAWAAAIEDDDDDISKDFEYPPVGHYIPFTAMVCFQAISFGTTISFTGPTIGDIIDDLTLCGKSDDGGAVDDDGNDDGSGLCSAASLAASVYALSAIAGSVLAGPLCDHPALGRRSVYLLNALVFLVGWVTIGTAQGFPELLGGRLLTGFATGVAGVVVPMYVGEMSPPPLRGVLGSLFNLGITVGVLGVNALSFFGVGWRQIAYLWGVIPQAVVLFCFAPSEKAFPESPEFLASVAVASAAAATHAFEPEQASVLFEPELLADITAKLRKGSLGEAFEMARVNSASSPHASTALKAQGRLGRCLMALHGLSGESAKKRAREVLGARLREQMQQPPHPHHSQQHSQQPLLSAEESGEEGKEEGSSRLDQQQQQEEEEEEDGHKYHIVEAGNTEQQGGVQQEEEEEAAAAAPVCLLCSGQYRRSALLATGMVCGFASSAVNCINAFSGSIFELAGADPGAGNLGFACAQTAVVLVGMLWFYEAFGRRPLLMVSSFGCSLGHACVFLAFFLDVDVLAVVGIVLFISSVSVGLGSLSWVYATEVLPGPVRAPGMSLANVLFWGISFALNNYFASMLETFGEQGTFLFFAALSAAVLLFVTTMAVETAGRSLQEIENLVAPPIQKKA